MRATFRALIRGAALASVLSFVASAGAADLASALKAFDAVGPQGKGNQEAAKAWNEVSQLSPGEIPAILSSMDQAGPLAANWYRAAVDAIAERTLKSGKSLPKAELEKFVLDQKHSAKSRKLAFDWLARIDESAPDRLIPGMLDDAGLPFRREAVARVITQAETLAKEDKKNEALAAYRTAFDKARDVDQIVAISKALKDLGEPVNVTDSMGFITNWKLIGPFDNTDMKGFDAAYPPETILDYQAEYDGKSGKVKWIDHQTTDEFGVVDLNKALGKANGVVAYAVTEFTSPDERPIEIRAGSGNANKIWLNGHLLNESRPYHNNEEIDQYVCRGTLKKGKNVILLKVLQNEQKESWAQKWQFQCRACDGLGTAVLSLDRPKTPPQAPANAVSAR